MAIHRIVMGIIFAIVWLPWSGRAEAAVVYTAGNSLTNLSDVDANDVAVRFKIPCFFCGGEAITGGSIIMQFANNATLIVPIINQGLSVYDQDIPLLGNFVVHPRETLDISGLIDSQKKNGLKWLRTMHLTKDGLEIRTRTNAGGFRVETAAESSSIAAASLDSPLVYTFSNDGSDPLFVSKIVLGLSPSLMTTFSPSDLLDVNIFDNGGKGWLLGIDEELALPVPFSLGASQFLVANVTGISAPDTAEAVDVDYLQDHQAIPEPSTLILLGIGITLLVWRRSGSVNI